ncbi:extracellular solute-binding protein [Nonomuraea soli]|uniref:Raffinose/stachyose/melibiose transport system substrate-binding protein n=1 Tax=Nonomuraea soli TaxID=1032476 RepID=A0A7W0HT42_9ACTN|nr:extracellular solute-binding protein [Nonomuraea soli]MBA2894341.1 raffinose/stachyose/melibiose transport system substrate-binding protein [Nonomuraea soli]
MRRHLVLCAATALFLAGCGSSTTPPQQSPQAGQSQKAEPVTVDWWHIATNDPGKSTLDKAAKAYMAEHPEVTIKITILENDAFKSKMSTVSSAGQAPDIFTTWGGGVLAQQVEAGLVKEVDLGEMKDSLTTAAVAPYVIDEKVYAVPTDIGMIGFWYNKDLFAKAGITEPPGTWSAYLEAVKKLKAAGIVPIALAGKEKWPGHFYWSYLAMRIAGLPALQQAAETKDFTNPDFVAAGQQLKALADLQPFQKGFENAAYPGPTGQSATVGNGKAAMELMGQWAPGSQKTEGKGLGEALGFFPFPAVEGGKGALTEAFGGGGGYAVGAEAPDAAVDFLKFLIAEERHAPAINDDLWLPIHKGEEATVSDPNKKAVAEALATATGFQLYLDQAYPPAVGQEVNDSVAQLIEGKKTPEEVVQSITEVAKSE